MSKNPGRQVARTAKFWRLRLKFAGPQCGTCFASRSSPFNFEVPLRYWEICVFLHNLCYLSSLQFYSFYLCGGIGQNGPRQHRFEVPSSHTIRHTHTHTQFVRFLCTRDQLVAVAATCTTYKKHKQTIIHTALHSTANGIGKCLQIHGQIASCTSSAIYTVPKL